MTKKEKRVGWLLLVIGLVFSIQTSSFAEESSDLLKQVGFTYKINHPDNQLGDGGALNLKMAPGQKQGVIVTITNTNKQDIVLSLSLNGARTNGNGGVEYGPSGFSKDKTMTYDLPDLVKIPKEVTIPKESSKDIVLDIMMPEVAYDGLVTGGVQLIEKGDEDPTSGTAIVNKVAYLFAVTLQMTDTPLIPEIELQKVYPQQSNYRNSIYLDIANVVPMRVKGLLLDVVITKEGQEEALYESKKTNMEMAPNTLMSYPLSLGGEKMIAGKYTAHVNASSNGKEWVWAKNFTITKEDADLFNQLDVSIVQERGLNWQVIILVAIGSVTAVVVGYSVFFRKKQNTRKSKPSERNRKIRN